MFKIKNHMSAHVIQCTYSNRHKTTLEIYIYIYVCIYIIYISFFPSNHLIITFGMSYHVRSSTEFPSVKVNHKSISQRTHQNCIILDIMSEKTDILILKKSE